MPDLVVVGMTAAATEPDGLWIAFGPDAGFADVIAIEHCGSRQNFYDKRSRYMATHYAKMLRCPLAWLMSSEVIQAGVHRPVWELCEVFGASSARLRQLQPFLCPFDIVAFAEQFGQNA